MGGLSKDSRRVTAVNANWTADGHGGDGAFELLIVTEDDERRSVALSPAAITALVAMATAPNVVLLWDPQSETLVTANIVGDWIPPDYSALPSVGPRVT